MITLWNKGPLFLSPLRWCSSLFFPDVSVLKNLWVNQNWSNGLIYSAAILLCLLDNYAISQIAVCLSWHWMETASLFLSLFSFLCSLVPSRPWSFFVVSSPGLVLNVDVRDELLGYAADVRRYAVSCLQPHLEISFLLPRCRPPPPPPLSPFSQRWRMPAQRQIQSRPTIPFSHFGLRIQGAWVCLYEEFSPVYIIRQTTPISYIL